MTTIRMMAGVAFAVVIGACSEDLPGSEASEATRFDAPAAVIAPAATQPEHPATLTAEQVVQREREVREAAGRLWGQGCGLVVNELGELRGGFWNIYVLPGDADAETRTFYFAYIQRGDGIPVSYSGLGFTYRRHDDRFMLDPARVIEARD